MKITPAAWVATMLAFSTVVASIALLVNTMSPPDTCKPAAAVAKPAPAKTVAKPKGAKNG